MDQFYTRKKLRLQDYDYTHGNVVYATICVQGRKWLLGQIRQPETAADAPRVELSEIGEIVNQYTSTIPGIEKYVIMPNHVHMIVFNREGEHISTKIRSWKTLITKAIGRPIWQREYYDHVIRDENDFLIKWKYIDDNPAKWANDKELQEG